MDRVVAQAAESLASQLGGVAVLFYGSALRTRSLDGVLDLYVLTPGISGTAMRRLGLRWLWPDVSYHEFNFAGHIVRFKVATMPLATFESAAAGATIDTTIWARFAQPAALVWNAGPIARNRVVRAVSDCIVTAARFAAVLGPLHGIARDYWLSLFNETYATEFRVEKPGRADTILDSDPERWNALLPLAWTSGKVPFHRDGVVLTNAIEGMRFQTIMLAWLRAARAGRILNIARLVKATFTFDGAARYALWKIERHTGLKLKLTPWRERHPILAAPGIMLSVIRSRAT